MIEIVKLTKRYRNMVAIEDVSFSLEKGEIVGFLGPNGAGKSTTMKILSGFMPATSGRAVLAGYNVFEEPMQVRRSLGYLPEVPPLYPDLTVLEYLRFVAGLKGLVRRDKERHCQDAMERVNVASQKNRLIRNLSKGFQQRVGIAQALLGNPAVLILDEPTVGLDPRQIGEVRKLIKSLAGDHTVILSTHILQEVTATCERVVVINQGRIVADDKLDQLVERHRTMGHGASLEEVFLNLTEV